LNDPSVPLAPLQLDFSHLFDDVQRLTQHFGDKLPFTTVQNFSPNNSSPPTTHNDNDAGRKIEAQLVHLLRVLMDNIQHVQQQLLLLADKVPVETSQQFRITLVSVLRNIRYLIFVVKVSFGLIFVSDVPH
jgi:hypothetical protein